MFEYLCLDFIATFQIKLCLDINATIQVVPLDIIATIQVIVRNLNLTSNDTMGSSDNDEGIAGQ